MIRLVRWLPLLLTLLLVPSCAMLEKKAAEKALDEAQLAYSQIADEAHNVAPDQAEAIEAGFAAANASMAKGDVPAVLAAANDLGGKVQTLAEALPDLKARLEDDWKVLGAGVPGALTALKQKLDDFGQPPAGMPGRARFDSTATQLAPLAQRWEEARSKFASGKLAAAVALAQGVREEAVKLIASIQTGS